MARPVCPCGCDPSYTERCEACGGQVSPYRMKQWTPTGLYYCWDPTDRNPCGTPQGARRNPYSDTYREGAA